MKKDFLWITFDGEVLSADEMATPHLLNALRMLWNHNVPPAFRVGKFTRHNEVYGWSREYRQDAISAFLAELNERDDLEQSDRDELADICDNAELLARILLAV